MLERLSGEARRAVRRAMAVTQSEYTTLDDLLSALLDSSTVAGSLLARLGYRQAVSAVAGMQIPQGKQFAPELIAVLYRSATIADEAEQERITTGHLLVALAESPQCPPSLTEDREQIAVDDVVRVAPESPPDRRGSRITGRMAKADDSERVWPTRSADS